MKSAQKVGGVFLYYILSYNSL